MKLGGIGNLDKRKSMTDYRCYILKFCSDTLDLPSDLASCDLGEITNVLCEKVCAWIQDCAGCYPRNLHEGGFGDRSEL